MLSSGSKDTLLYEEEYSESFIGASKILLALLLETLRPEPAAGGKDIVVKEDWVKLPAGEGASLCGDILMIESEGGSGIK